jgi:hypothetical protein
MASPFTSLLDLRQKAEKQAAGILDRAVAARAAEEAEQNRLVTRWRQALTALDDEGERLAFPPTGAQAMTRDRYRAGLRADVARAARGAEVHRLGALAAALRAEGDARASLEQAHAAAAAIARLLAREQAEAARQAEHRAEDAASDLANAAFLREPH